MDEPLDEKDWIWLAGFLDARGTLGMKNGRARVYVRSSDFEVMNRIGQLLDANVRGPFFNGRGNNEAAWVIQVYDHDKLSGIFRKIGDYLSETRRAAFADMLHSGKPKRPKMRTTFSVENCGRYTVAIPTLSGYRAHMNAGEEPCRVCMESSRMYYRQRRERDAA
jgi:hypothetical protein